MGRLKPDLFQLIKSLDKSEKRYFKRYTLLHSGGAKTSTNYTQLFDAIDEMNEYDEQVIKKKFEGTKFIKQLFSTKKYLYESILKSLRSYMSQAGDNMEILSGIQSAEILIRKGHYEKALDYISAAKQLSRKTEFWGYYNELIELERLIYNIERKENTVELIAGLNDEKTNVANAIKNDLEYVKLTHKILPDVQKYGKVLIGNQSKQLMLLFESELLKDNYMPLTLFGKGIKSSTKTIYYGMTNQIDKNYIETKASFNLLKENPSFIQKNPVSYFTKFSNYGLTLANLKKYDELEELLNDSEEFSKLYQFKLNPKLSALQFEKIALLKSFYLIQTAQYEKELSYIKSIAFEIENYRQHISRSSINTFYFTAAQTYIACGQYKPAIKNLNQILIFNKSEIKQSENMFAKYLLVISHYELGNIHMLKNINDMFLPDESIEALDYLCKELPLIKNSTMEKAILLKFKNLYNKSDQKKTIDQYFDFSMWAESKIQNKPFAKITQPNS